MPDGKPLHLLPYGKLLEYLRAATNVRVVEDPSSDVGYRLGVGLFPGWDR